MEVPDGAGRRNLRLYPFFAAFFLQFKKEDLRKTLERAFPIFLHFSF
jgi:hypothetical protein